MADAWGGAWSDAWGAAWGFSASTATDTTDHHDGGRYSEEERDRIRRRIREYEKARERSEKERRASQKRLHNALQAAYRRVLGEEPAVAQEIAALAPALPGEAPLPGLDLQRMSDLLDAAYQVLDILERDRRLAEWTAADEADIEILLLS